MYSERKAHGINAALGLTALTLLGIFVHLEIAVAAITCAGLVLYFFVSIMMIVEDVPCLASLLAVKRDKSKTPTDASGRWRD